ncbi:hypothetical protein FOXG_14077 [Fusarium oxysporum f. sp. lycopersici 4287]|uniref:Heterokaryon incompatibility domain-containing protein n=1 Tax=Fusarium oxysporum f. sp. lycopersici (strain 4287 / CBS 123668 / FGSC 9935 / NRRL 34936) TaxID=426428 RepID=A0A0J9VXV0_FUSO4|nr:hypothetical protein FOXG_12460 [Fusarium oxysporum f. sp. lycopersici 4287]XP_018253636.1 hypothetical protein FOXG_14077 [Fusarium oxysporum f. sp. lycopersici 4287]EWZ78364.1 hypothetical protein FOWG_17378 [Fusarium oxysporum f. sp. lycopersici MN25]KAJ9412996.1 hypothetical protein QL093DRAFT_1127758 [Fusarium oxysporum]KNB13752.1 hypothetical protein FOXG_12460 [Fusarium oxysporum f. sp. lycopersici 4287]KNB15591.1 hypothetical protein FOXG_14077 [Fusarium oxysporum f. sp. lycopersici
MDYALCIIQDDPEDWQRESIKMRDVYKNALVTICAQDSPNPFGGCFSRRDPLIRRPIVLPLYNEEGLLDGELFWSRDVGVPSGSPGPLGPLDYRAWTLQEQVLSGRVLAYCEGTVFWFCSTTALWEAKPIWEKDIQRLSDYAKLKRLVINYDAWPVSRMLRSAKKTRRAAYDAWYDLVGKYSGRNITKPKDRMVAISAVAEAMSLILDDQYVAGLWKRDIIRGLLWMSVRGRNVRPRRAKRGQGYVAPSWSWASINHGAVLALFSMKLNCGILTYGSQIITPEFRFRRYEYMEELPVKAPSDPEILTVQCSNIGTSPFGQVKSGTIRLKGYTREVVLRPRGKNLYDRALHTKIGKAHIDEFRLLSSRKLVVTCLFMARYVKEDEEAFLSSSKDIQQFGKCICLGLVPTRLRKNEYRRIGLAEIDYWKWDMEEKREIFLV